MKLHPSDTVEVNLETGHKVALRDIKAGEPVIKYGFPIGHATIDIAAGEPVHTHNLKTNLSGTLTYTYRPNFSYPTAPAHIPTFLGYRREDGCVGIRNDIWIVNTVGCVNKTAQILAQKTGAKYFSHPFGCSQLGGDQSVTQAILAGMVRHPNAGGVLVLGLGCENNNIDIFKTALGGYNPDRVKFLNTQDAADEIAEGCALIAELQRYASQFRREQLPISELKIGLKCGGSDGYSGITGNPLLGQFSDYLIACGGTAALTEVPEMFGAETLLMERCETKEVFDSTVALINDFKDYFTRHNQVVYENPSPGNKAGGITTLEEKSLGCVQKGGAAPVRGVLNYGDRLRRSGLHLLNGPGNDMVAVTNLTACGVHMILFTTGRGTPLGAPVPTVKVSTNSPLAQKKPGWIDFDAGRLLTGASMAELTQELTALCIDIAGGRQTKNEQNGYEEISIFKDGVVL